MNRLLVLSLFLSACAGDVLISEFEPEPEAPTILEFDAPVLDTFAVAYDLDYLLAHASYRVELGVGLPQVIDDELLLDAWGSPVGLVRVDFTLPAFTEIEGQLWVQPEGGLDDDGAEYFAFYVGDRAIYAGGDYGPDLSEESRGWIFSETFAEAQTTITLEVASDSEGEALLVYFAEVWAK